MPRHAASLAIAALALLALFMPALAQTPEMVRALKAIAAAPGRAAPEGLSGLGMDEAFALVGALTRREIVVLRDMAESGSVRLGPALETALWAAAPTRLGSTR